MSPENISKLSLLKTWLPWCLEGIDYMGRKSSTMETKGVGVASVTVWMGLE